MSDEIKLKDGIWSEMDKASKKQEYTTNPDLVDAFEGLVKSMQNYPKEPYNIPMYLNKSTLPEFLEGIRNGHPGCLYFLDNIMWVGSLEGIDPEKEIKEALKEYEKTQEDD